MDLCGFVIVTLICFLAFKSKMCLKILLPFLPFYIHHKL